MFIAKASSTLYSKCFYNSIFIWIKTSNSNRVVKPLCGLPYTALLKKQLITSSPPFVSCAFVFSICFTQWGHYIMEFPEHLENPIGLRLRAGLTGLRLMQRSNSSRWKCFFSRETFRDSCDWKPRHSSRCSRFPQNNLVCAGNIQNKISCPIMRRRI